MKSELISCTGIIKFNPVDKTKKHKSQATWKRVAMILTGDDIAEYYAWFIKRRYNLQLNKPLRGTHVTFINDRVAEVPLFDRAQKLYDGKKIKFYIDPNPRTDGKYWWLKVTSATSERIRRTAGGTPQPYYPMHLTIGYADDRNIEHAEYIHKCILKFS